MKIFRDLDNIHVHTAVALGNFDSMHIGHKRIIKECKEQAVTDTLTSVVLCFNELPLNVISGEIRIKNVLSFDDKAEEVENLGIDYLVSIDFDESIRTMEAEEFVKEILVDKLHAKKVFCGFNYSFGYMGLGTPELLFDLGKKYGFSTIIIPECTVNGNTVSSTDVRLFLSKGNLKSYKEYTGRDYSLSGIVSHGESRGERMGFPTINIYPEDRMQLPIPGVYSTITEISDDTQLYCSISYVGTKPTFDGEKAVIETHIFDFNRNIYDQKVKITFLEFMRDEYKFNDEESLINQIEKDCEKALQHRISVVK